MTSTPQSAYQKEWWARWFAENYCWDALQYKRIGGNGAVNGATNLQEYWRRDPANPHIVRNDEVMRAAGELIPEGNGKLWHIAHYPPRLADGTETWKSETGGEKWKQLSEIISTRVRVAGAQRVLARPDKLSGKEGRALLTGVVLEDFPTMPQEEDLLHICANNSAFLAVISAADVQLGRRAEFENCIFEDSAYFEDIDSKDVSFAHSLFCGDANFMDCNLGLAKFNKTRFLREAWFGGVRFPTIVNFTEANFAATAGFSSVIFSSTTYFDGVVFEGGANFADASFSGQANFRGTKFFGRASFQGSSTKDESAAVEQSIELEASELSSSSPKIVGKIRIPATDNALKKRSFRQISFTGGEFHRDADFSNRTFLAATDFSHVRFRQLALFHDARLHQDTSFAGARFDMPATPSEESHTSLLAGSSNSEELTLQQLNRHFEDYERAFRTLKLAMEGHRARREEARFFRKELEARRRRPSIKSPSGDPKEVTIAEKAVSKLYEVTSAFGESLLLPVWWLLALWAGFGFAYAWLSGDLKFGCWIWEPGCRISSAITLAGERTWLPFLSQDNVISAWWRDSTAQNHLLTSVLGIVHRVCSALLIFLLALAAKRKYQIS